MNTNHELVITGIKLVYIISVTRKLQIFKENLKFWQKNNGISSKLAKILVFGLGFYIWDDVGSWTTSLILAREERLLCFAFVRRVPSSPAVPHTLRGREPWIRRCRAFLLLFTMQCLCVLHHNAPTLNTVLFGNKIKRLYFHHGVTVMASPADASPCVGSDDI